MADKLVASEQLLKQFLALLEQQTQKDTDTIMRVWNQLIAQLNQKPRSCV